MPPVIRIDDDVMNEIKRRAVEYNMVFSTPNDVLKRSLGLEKTVNSQSPPSKESAPRSKNPKIQKLIDGLLPTIHSLSDGLRHYSRSDRWVTYPDNFATIKVQDARVDNLSITVRGKPNKFDEFNHVLSIKADRPSYSRFNIDREDQLAAAIAVIKIASAV